MNKILNFINKRLMLIIGFILENYMHYFRFDSLKFSMKVKPKTLTTDGTNRISALKRLSKPTTMNTNVHQRLSAPTTPMITDARQLLTNRNKPVFDARQLLSRQSSNTKNTSLIIRRDIEPEEEEEEGDDNQETVVLQRSNNGRVCAEYPFMFRMLFLHSLAHCWSIGQEEVPFCFS
jgi:hypothetical protein